MKPVAFDYARPSSVREAVGLLSTPEAKVLAGGQTLGPMLNLRLAQPRLLVDITRIPELAAVDASPESVTIGAGVTHAAIEDGRIDDPTHGFMALVASGIAYRAVRTRGTIGGSLAHADPAADWLSCLTALGAELATSGPGGQRRLPLTSFMRGAMDTVLEPAEVLTGIRITRFSRQARFGFHKICRKTGEFAEAIGVAVFDPERNLARLVAGTPAGPPIVLEDMGRESASPENGSALHQHLAQAGFTGDAYELKLAVAAVQRAAASARKP
jgi:aerobic carbon-monoxide dehydrogenase medium subunit